MRAEKTVKEQLEIVKREQAITRFVHNKTYLYGFKDALEWVIGE